jgi:hypothetical protein
MIVAFNSNIVLLNDIHGYHPVIIRLILSLIKDVCNEETDVDASMHSSRITRINASMNKCPIKSMCP